MPRLWRESLGERGCRVMLFESTPGGPIYREVWVGGGRVAALLLPTCSATSKPGCLGSTARAVSRCEHGRWPQTLWP